MREVGLFSLIFLCLSTCFRFVSTFFVKSFFSKLLLLGSSDERNDSQAYYKQAKTPNEEFRYFLLSGRKQDVMKISRTILVLFCYLAEKGMCSIYIPISDVVLLPCHTKKIALCMFVVTFETESCHGTASRLPCYCQLPYRTKLFQDKHTLPILLLVCFVFQVYSTNLTSSTGI